MHLNRANKRVSVLFMPFNKEPRLYISQVLKPLSFSCIFTLVLKTSQGSASFGGVLGNRTVKNETGRTTPERQVRHFYKYLEIR